MTINERGLTSAQWTVYSGGTKRVQYSTVPTSSITSEVVMVDGVALSQKDTAGITTTSTRPLAIQKDGTWYTCGWDLTKNICEVYRTSGTLGTSYTYTPYGQVSAEGATEQPIQWSSEFNDTELGLVYYNYRHYNPVVGRWMSRDIKVSAKGNHVYAYVSDSPILYGNQLGQDRYYFFHSGVCRFHGVLIIDNWEKVGCKYKKRKPVEYGLEPTKVKYFDSMLDVFLTYLRPLIVTNFEYYYPLYISRWAYINASIKKTYL